MAAIEVELQSQQCQCSLYPSKLFQCGLEINSLLYATSDPIVKFTIVVYLIDCCNKAYYKTSAKKNNLRKETFYAQGCNYCILEEYAVTQSMNYIF